MKLQNGWLKEAMKLQNGWAPDDHYLIKLGTKNLIYRSGMSKSEVHVVCLRVIVCKMNNSHI